MTDYRWVRLRADPDGPVGLVVEDCGRTLAVVWQGESRPRRHGRRSLFEYVHKPRPRSWGDYLEARRGA